MLTARLSGGCGRIVDWPFIWLLQCSGVSRNSFIGNVTPTHYSRRCAYPGSNGIMIITGNCQYLVRTNDPHHLEHMMLPYTECSGTGARKRTTNI
jgi:hypothetical protein